MSRKVTTRNFAQAESAHYFAAQVRRAPVNAFHHERDPATLHRRAAIRPNLDLLHSYAVVDVTEQATFALAPSDEYQADQVIDEHGRTVAVVYPGETLSLRSADLSGGTHVFVLGRTALFGGIARARELQDLRRITAATENPYHPADWDDRSRLAVRTDREPPVAWGTLPREHAQYFEGVTTSSGCDVWTFEAPPVDLDHHGFYSVVRYDEHGRIDVDHAAIAGPEMMRNGDGSISVYFGGDACMARGNVIRTPRGRTFRYGMRLYRPRHLGETARYLDGLRERGLEVVHRG